MQNFPEKERKESFSRDEILGSLEAQGSAGALLSPSALSPSSFLLTFLCPSLPPLLPFLLFLFGILSGSINPN